MQWDEFSDQMKNVTPYVPYMVCPGNHESDSKNSEYVQTYVTAMLYCYWFCCGLLLSVHSTKVMTQEGSAMFHISTAMPCQDLVQTNHGKGVYKSVPICFCHLHCMYIHVCAYWRCVGHPECVMSSLQITSVTWVIMRNDATAQYLYWNPHVYVQLWVSTCSWHMWR